MHARSHGLPMALGLAACCCGRDILCTLHTAWVFQRFGIAFASSNHATARRALKMQNISCSSLEQTPQAALLNHLLGRVIVLQNFYFDPLHARYVDAVQRDGSLHYSSPMPELCPSPRYCSTSCPSRTTTKLRNTTLTFSSLFFQVQDRRC